MFIGRIFNNLDSIELYSFSKCFGDIVSIYEPICVFEKNLNELKSLI